MTKIKKLIERIEDELEGAKDYAESYIECKVKGDTTTSQKFRSMAEDELKHAMFFHEKAVKEIEELSKAVAVPVEMAEKWEHEHKEYVERAAWIRQMLAM